MKPIKMIFKTVSTVFLVLALILPASAGGVFLDPSKDGGTDYRDRLLFLGESTTAHLRSRGVLIGGTSTDRVLAPKSGTMMLNRRILSARVIEPQSGKEMTIPEAVALRRPEILVLSFGLNGILGFVSQKDAYLEPYKALIREIRSASPETVIVLQTVYPVAQNPTEWKYSQTPAEINRAIETVNAYLPEIAESESVFIADTASVLRDANGYLRADFSADGIHLTRAGYEAVLFYLQTHRVEVAK